MKTINRKIITVGSTHEVKARLQANTKSNWDYLKSELEASNGTTYSDSSFFNWAVNELASYQQQTPAVKA